MFKKELRLILTEDCNYDCIFCHKEGMKKYEVAKLAPEDYSFLFEVCKETFNWDEVTLTGGEPYVRKDIDQIIKRIHDKKGKITIVTNGELINRHFDSLKYIHRINLSIHSMDSKKYDNIVQRKNKLPEILKNIAAIKNFYPDLNLRLNSVIIRGENDDEEKIKEFIEFARRIGASIKFVELYSSNKKEIVEIDEISQKLKNIGFKYKDVCNIAKQELTDGEVTVILSRIFCANAISQIQPEEYCNKYNDFFITPEGNINICRNAKEDISIYKEIKNRDKQNLIKKFQLAIKHIGQNCPICKDEKKLAINGGTPIFPDKDKARFIHPKITPEIEQAVIDQLHKSISIYDNKGIFEEFETSFANYHQTKYALTFSSGTAALWGMYDGIGLKAGDEVICPCYTFFATVTPILLTGAKPILVDCDNHGNIDINEIKKKINKKTKAIVITHMWGYPCKLDKIRKIADENNLYLLEDCSHAHGARYKNKPIGTIGDAAAFSLQGQKIITGGEGGILITNNKKIKDRALLLGHYNKRCKLEINPNDELYKYATTGKGMKLRAHPIAIRIANEYFKNIDKINNVKNKYANKIIKELKDIKGIEVLEPEADCKNSWYALIIKYDQEQMKGISRERFVEALHAEGAIEVDIPNSTCPLDSLELFKKHKILYPNDTYEFDYTDKFESAHKFYNNIIKIPIWYGEDEEEIIIKYIRAIKKVCNNIKELV